MVPADEAEEEVNEDEEDELAAEWEAMMSDGDDEADAGEGGGGREATRVLNQDEIDFYLASTKIRRK